MNPHSHADNERAWSVSELDEHMKEYHGGVPCDCLDAVAAHNEAHKEPAYVGKHRA
jgi:hypothetical protein